MLIDKKIKEDEIAFENEAAVAAAGKRIGKRKPSDSTTSSSSYETPIHKADSIDFDKSKEILPKPVIYKTFDDLQKKSEGPEEEFLEKRHTYPFADKKQVDVFGDNKDNPNLPPPLKPFDSFSDDGGQLKMPPHIRPAEEEVDKEPVKPETPVKPISFDWFFRSKKPVEEGKPPEEEKKKLKSKASKSSDDSSSDSDDEKVEAKKSSGLKIPSFFGIRSSKREKAEEQDNVEKVQEEKLDEELNEEEPKKMTAVKLPHFFGIRSSKREEKAKEQEAPSEEQENAEKVKDEKEPQEEEPRKSSAVKLPHFFGKRSSKKDKSETADDEPENKVDEEKPSEEVIAEEPKKSSAMKLPSFLKVTKKSKPEAEVEEPQIESEDKPLQELKDGEWVDIPSEFQKRDEKPESAFKKMFGIKPKSDKEEESDTTDSDDDEKPEEHKRLGSLTKWLKNRTKHEDVAEEKPEIEESKAEPKKSGGFNIGKYFGKSDKEEAKSSSSESESDAEESKKKNRSKRWLGTKQKESVDEAEPKEDDENKPEVKKSSGFNIGKYFGKSDSKEDPKSSDSEIESDAEESKNKSRTKRWSGTKQKESVDEESKPDEENKPEAKKTSGFSIGKYFGKSDSKEDKKSSDSESDSDAEENKKPSTFARWLGSGRKSKGQSKVESEDSFKKEMQQKDERDLEDKIMPEVDKEEDKVSQFTSDSQEELSKPETITEEPEKEEEKKAEEKPRVSFKRMSMKVPPPLPPSPPPLPSSSPPASTPPPVPTTAPPLPLVPPQSAWGPKGKKNRGSGRQSNESISSSSKESLLNPDSDKKDEPRPRSWRMLDENEGIEIITENKKEEKPEGKAEDKHDEGKVKDKKTKKGKQSRPVSFAENVATVMGAPSDTESADHGSGADKSSVSKLTNEKQSKKPKLMGSLIDSFKKKSRDKVADNEASKGTALESNKDPEQLPLDGTKTEGIVYAELDIARGQGTGVMRRDDDKTEYAEIIHPKASETKKSKEELRKSRENLSGSREHLTEPEGEPKKEATV